MYSFYYFFHHITFFQDFVCSITNKFTLVPGAELYGAVWINQFTLSVLCAFFEMADVNGAVAVEFSAIATYLILFILSLQNLIVRKHHSIDAVADVRPLSELSQPHRALLIDHLLELKIRIIEVEGPVDVVQEVRNRQLAQFLPILQ